MAVLLRSELEASPLADLHAIASELAIEGYRRLRREQLVESILEQGGGEDDGPAAEPAGANGSADEAPRERPPRRRRRRSSEDDEPAASRDEDSPPSAEPEVRSGSLDVLPNGSGFIRAVPGEQSKDDVYISPAQIRRVELRAGDVVAGPVRRPRRSERYPSLVRVEQVNGAAPDEGESGRRRFEGLTPVFPTERLELPEGLEAVPFGKGSRVAIGGPPGAGATTLLRRLAATMAERHGDIEWTVVLAGVRPEEVPEWRAASTLNVRGGSFDHAVEEQAREAEAAVEQAKRAVESGRDAGLIVDSLDALPPAVARRVFGAARKTEEGGTLTVIAATGTAGEPQRQATTRIVLDIASPEERPRVSEAASGVMRQDLLGS